MVASDIFTILMTKPVLKLLALRRWVPNADGALLLRTCCFHERWGSQSCILRFMLHLCNYFTDEAVEWTQHTRKWAGHCAQGCMKYLGRKVCPKTRTVAIFLRVNTGARGYPYCRRSLAAALRRSAHAQCLWRPRIVKPGLNVTFRTAYGPKIGILSRGSDV